MGITTHISKMFTGIVESIGIVSRLVQHDESSSGGGGTSLTISNCADVLVDANLGDSISINGTCLTVTEFSKDEFKVGVSPETLRRTNLGSLKEGSGVNLERAVSASTRMGGHFVQGHVDTVATVVSVTPDGNALTFRLQPREKGVLRYIVEKGYITLDGASLTITNVNDEQAWFEVMLIAYTQTKRTCYFPSPSHCWKYSTACSISSKVDPTQAMSLPAQDDNGSRSSRVLKPQPQPPTGPCSGRWDKHPGPISPSNTMKLLGRNRNLFEGRLIDCDKYTRLCKPRERGSCDTNR